MEEQRWYLADGREVELIEQCKNGCIVREIYDGDDDNKEPRYSKPRWVETVYRSSAVPRLLPELERRTAEHAELVEKIKSLRSEIQDATAERARILDKLKQVPALQYLEDFIDGKFTHYVFENYLFPTVHEITDLLLDDEDRRYSEKADKFKLLSLMGRTNGDLQWRQSHYGDGSGNSYNVWLFRSRDEAVVFASAIITEALAKREEWRCGREAIKAYEAIGVEPPAGLVERTLEREARAKAERAEKLEAELAALR